MVVCGESKQREVGGGYRGKGMLEKDGLEGGGGG